MTFRKLKNKPVVGPFLSEYSTLNERAVLGSKRPLVIVKTYYKNRDHVYFFVTTYKRGNKPGEWTFDGKSGKTTFYSFRKYGLTNGDIRIKERALADRA